MGISGTVFSCGESLRYGYVKKDLQNPSIETLVLYLIPDLAGKLNLEIPSTLLCPVIWSSLILQVKTVGTNSIYIFRKNNGDLQKSGSLEPREGKDKPYGVYSSCYS